MAKTTVRSAQLRNLSLLLEDLKDFGVEEASGLDVTVNAGRVRDGTTITDKTAQTVALTDDSTNYVEITAAGVASANTSAFTSGRIPLATVVTASGSVSSITDKRAWTIVDNTGAGSAPGDLSDTTKELWIALMEAKIVEDQTSSRAANEVGDMRADVFSDDTGIDSGLSSDYSVRGTPNFDVITASGTAELFRPGDISSGLQGYWKLDEISGSRADSSGNGNTLTDNNTVGSSDEDYWDSDEKSADFESSNSESLSITDGSQTGLDITTTGLSMAFWIKLESTTGSNQSIIGKSDDTVNDRAYLIYFNNSTSKLTFQLSSDGTSTTEVSSSTSIQVGVWYHVAGVFDNTNNKQMIYINGNLESTVINSSNINNSGASFRIGAFESSGTPNLFTDGLIKDAAVWNTNITPAQVKSLALGVNISTLAFRPDNSDLATPVSYWKLNEISDGTNAISRTDSAGSNDLTDNNTTGSAAGFMEGVGADFESTNNEYLNITHASQSGLNLNATKFTIAAWIKGESFGGTHVIVDKSGGGSGYQLRIDSTGTITAIINSTAFTTTTALATGVWYHIAFVYDQTNAIIYIDGKADKTTAHSTDVTTSTNDFIVGTNAGFSDDYDGLMSDLAIWNTNLSAANIASLGCGLPLQLSGVVSYYKLDEASGNATDAIGSNNLTDNNTVGSGTGQVANGRDFELANTEYFSISDGNQTGLDLTTRFTILAWVKPESAATDISIAGKTVNPFTTGYILRTKNAAGDVWELSIFGSGTVASNTGVTVGSFQHIGAVYDGATATHYRNSVSDGSGTVSPATDGAGEFQLGAAGTGGDVMDGVLDEVVIAARQFRDEEIKAAYNKGLNGKEFTSSEVAVSSTATIISTSWPLSQTPDRVMIVENKTVNSGSITFYVSRVSSPGTNLGDTTKWTALSEKSLTDISGQDSGSTARWAAVITGDAELDDIAVVFGVN